MYVLKLNMKNILKISNYILENNLFKSNNHVMWGYFIPRDRHNVKNLIAINLNRDKEDSILINSKILNHKVCIFRLNDKFPDQIFIKSITHTSENKFCGDILNTNNEKK